MTQLPLWATLGHPFLPLETVFQAQRINVLHFEGHMATCSAACQTCLSCLATVLFTSSHWQRGIRCNKLCQESPLFPCLVSSPTVIICSLKVAFLMERTKLEMGLKQCGCPSHHFACLVSTKYRAFPSLQTVLTWDSVPVIMNQQRVIVSYLCCQKKKNQLCKCLL